MRRRRESPGLAGEEERNRKEVMEEAAMELCFQEMKEETGTGSTLAGTGHVGGGRWKACPWELRGAEVGRFGVSPFWNRPYAAWR